MRFIFQLLAGLEHLKEEEKSKLPPLSEGFSLNAYDIYYLTKFPWADTVPLKKIPQNK